MKGIKNEQNEIILSAGENYPTEWFTTQNEADRSKFLINNITNPSLIPNSLDQSDSTYLVVKAINLAGVASAPDTISFFVKEGFYPGSIIYDGKNQDGNDTWILGEDHYTKFYDNVIGKTIMNERFADGVHYSTPFWIDKDGNFAALNSPDLRIYLHWGWHGEFGNPTEGVPTITDNPYGKRINSVLDEQTGESYFAEIEYFDLRLDGQPFDYDPFPPEGENLQTDIDGKQWLRVPITHQISQNAILTNLSVGDHKFEIRAVDIQNAVDETPAVLEFVVVDKVDRDQKDGILILDDDDDNSVLAPDDLIDNFYYNCLSNLSDNVAVLDRNDLMDNVYVESQHFDRAVFSPTDLEKYKYVVYHSDNPVNTCNFYKEFEVFEIYLKGGGNLIISGGANLSAVKDRLLEFHSNIFDKYFGISENSVITADFLTSFSDFPYFMKAVSMIERVDDLLLERPSWNQLIEIYNGLSGTTGFLNHNCEEIYSFGCKPVGDGPYDPSQTKFDELNHLPVALRKITDDNSCYMFGFPLSYMNLQQVTEILEALLSE